ncbi:MAG: lipoprotein-releasing ABC transporter permease subunit [Desulfobacterium sp.]|jgi:lipoprotein-releasing system permease protein|nr:lipoprotein-releasing ABC transporter permease subunit [Desulfobacterium sp.]
MPLEFFIAARYLRAKQREGFISLITLLSVAGVTVGVMALVIVIAVMSGAESEFRRRILGVEPHVLVMNHSAKPYDVDDTVRRAMAVPGVTAVSPMVFAQTMIRTSHSLSGAVVRGIDHRSSLSLVKGFSPSELEVCLARDGKGLILPGIVLGKELAKNLAVAVDDKIVLISPGGMISPVGHVPALKRFRVTGIFESGMYEYDSSLAYVHLVEAQKLMGMGDRISALGVWVNDIFKADRIKTALVAELDYPFYARDWMEINKSLFAALKLEKTAMFVILTLIVLVAAFNIASALIMMVMEKTRDIAVLKAMGATDALVRRVFMVQGMVVGLFGTFLGTVSGVGVCLLLERYKFIELPPAYPFSTIPVQLETMDVLFIVVSAVLICFVSTIYPAHKASRMNPVTALRYG